MKAIKISKIILTMGFILFLTMNAFAAGGGPQQPSGNKLCNGLSVENSSSVKNTNTNVIKLTPKTANPICLNSQSHNGSYANCWCPFESISNNKFYPTANILDNGDKFLDCINSNSYSSNCSGKNESPYMFINHIENISNVWYECSEDKNANFYLNTSVDLSAVKELEKKRGVLIGTNCKKQNSFINLNQGGIAPPSQPKDIIILDSWDNSWNNGITKVHTKISGKKASFHIFAKDANNTIGSGLKSLTCNIDGKSSAAAKEVSTGFLGISKVFQYDAPDTAFESSGSHTIKCDGFDKDDHPVSGSFSFYSAPYSYNYKLSVSFNSKTTKNGMVDIYSLDSKVKIGEKFVYNKIFAVNNNNIQDKPVVILGDDIKLTLIAEAYNAKGNIDSGVNSNIDQEYIHDTMVCPVQNGVVAQDKQPKFTKGVFKGQASSLVFSEVYDATVHSFYYDKDITDEVKIQSNKGLCSGNGDKDGDCPFPPKVEIGFNYQVVPANFKLDLKKTDGNSVNVLYYGQGNTPEAEKNTKNMLEVSPLDSNGDVLKNFIYGCASQDVDIDMTLDNSTGIVIELIDPNTGQISNTISSNNFKTDNNTNAAKATADKIVSVKLNGGNNTPTPFTPALQKEPLFIDGNNFNGRIFFTNYDPKNPKYVPNNPSIIGFYPEYPKIILNQGSGEIVILRARINAVDTDNAVGQPTTRVYYEFQCNYCDLDKVKKATGIQGDYQQSPTQQGWFIDMTFNKHNLATLTNAKIDTPEKVGLVNTINPQTPTNGVQQISYNSATAGKYKVLIKHGNDANMMPAFLLYSPYWNIPLNNTLYGYTSSYVNIRNKASNNSEDYGVDTGNAKNTRSGGRTGAF
ncbi:MAG: hypothetical protein K2P17_07320 [Helicobacteraceae bacterium]|nr:hypothetical protein [Helicobacteraceae bacterium]